MVANIIQLAHQLSISYLHLSISIYCLHTIKVDWPKRKHHHPAIIRWMLFNLVSIAQLPANIHVMELRFNILLDIHSIHNLLSTSQCARCAEDSTDDEKENKRNNTTHARLCDKSTTKQKTFRVTMMTTHSKAQNDNTHTSCKRLITNECFALWVAAMHQKIIRPCWKGYCIITLTAYVNM